MKNYILYKGERIYKVIKMGRVCFQLRNNRRTYLHLETVKAVIDNK